mmetsp:Transcript_25228/g.54340  ORF Transcript_25228/g.54340 Transcript_25228/m.54340 type:complete len:173 (+) Transcript_25228:89-607(+)|eukprot:CAMPEP_0172323684 /NCGR_PEP_ID=MMETSP1058-20130122/49428_1 /TAXON_ID=83371 /ORGANISM="Detonula confervacea, Strain CCMP 353" /LENGTH=172 /DNA_ID=CAMNT_0013039761 /DNA_START=46 /DNA_END=564 /DNA_ORIENTATION=+
MAAVAQAETVNMSAPEDEAANDAPHDESDPIFSDADEDHQDDEDDEEEHEEHETKEWDEGGKSHCGYGDTVHDTLMSIGESIHKVVGEPTNEGVQHAMKSVGNWFQEASYAARDLKSGKMDLGGETAAAMKSVVSGDEDENKEDCEGEGDEHQEEKLEVVEEDADREEASSS